MKTVLLILFVFLSILSFSQENNWSPEELQQLEMFETTTKDHRGVRFEVMSCDNPSETLMSAIESFFMIQKKQDITVICISSMIDDEIDQDVVYDVHDLVKLYLEASKK